MARKRRRRKTKKTALDYIALPRLDLEDDTKRGIAILLILALGAISLLSIFNLAGALGELILKVLTLVFGLGKILFPITLLVWGFLLYNEDRYYIKGTNYLGYFLFLISFQSLLHFFIEKSKWQEKAEIGLGGGYLGMYLASGFLNVLGFWAGLLVLICLLLASLMLMFDTSLSRLIGGESLFAKILYHLKLFFNKFFNSEEDDEDEEEEIEEDDEDEEEDDAGAMGFFKTKKIKSNNIDLLTKKEKTETKWKASNIKIDLPLDLLNNKAGKSSGGDLKNNALIIQKTLENFGIPVEMGEISVGPTVTQYTFKPAEGIKLSRITALNNDLALALAAHPIRIEAPIPGKALVGVEVPNQSKAIVGLKEILSDKQFKNRKTQLMLALGKDVSGQSWFYNLSKMPHLLVAGATNSGKSVCLNSIIISLLYQNNPDDLRFIMVDPKRVELPVYNGIPHLLTPVITDVKKTINALKWCLNEMDRRFEILSQKGYRNIQTYNTKSKPEEKMPYIVFIIDELADLMVAAARDIEGNVIRLAQMARAVGIHLILATQRPSVDVITGLIKANMPARIAFSVASGTDSKTILDSLGAEKLLGQGDMLFLTAEISKPKRIQGAFVSDQEIKKIVNYIKEKGGEPNYVEGITDRQKVKGVAGVGLDSDTGDGDDLLEEAKEIVINMGKASASLLQRRLSIGYARAARIMDELEEIGVIGPANGAKPRDILITKEQYESMQNQGISGVSLHDREEAQAPENYLGEEPETPPAFLSDNEGIEEDDNKEAEEESESSYNEISENKNDKNVDKNYKKDSNEDKDFKEEESEEYEEEKNKKSDSLDDEEGMFFSK